MGKRGPQPLTAEVLAARGSWRAGPRKAEGQPAEPTPAGPKIEWTPPTDADLDAVILGVPGFDPYREADDCWFDYDAARGVIGFFETKLLHVEGKVAGKPFHLEPWETAVVANLFGWKRLSEDGRPVRRFREGLIYVPRKNGKTPLCAGICLYLLFEDKEPGAQIVSAAAERGQAALLFRHARGMVAQSADLSDRAQVFGGAGQLAIVLKADPAASYKPISAEAFTKHGLNLHAAIIDELHAQPNRDLVDTLATAMASANRLQPLMLYITTADYQRLSICNEKYDRACKVRDGILSDPAFLPVVYEAAREEDWKTEAVWEKANPNIDVSVSRDYLRRECQRAQETPTYENVFKRLHLNMQTEQNVRWLAMDVWDATGAGDPLAWRAAMASELAGCSCTAGLDLSTKIDLTAFTLTFRRGRKVVVLPYFWVPRENADKREKRDRVPYLTWARQGLVTLTDGNVTDYDVVRRDIVALGKLFNIDRICFDRWNASQLVTQLQGDGFELAEFGQGFASFTAPAKEFEALLIDKRLDHGGNPVLRWMASNTAAQIDPAGNIKPDKEKSTDRIDGIVAAIMALGGMMKREPAEGKFIWFFDE